ncbi:hypothetical protein M569_15706, partial [Genlisea aurea]
MSEIDVDSEIPSKSTNINSASRIICRVCEKQFSQYTCPRCNTRYCSLRCYKSHSLRCTESFMRDNVMEELQQIQPNQESRLKMLDILKRLHELDEEDNFDENDDPSLSEETIQKILSGSSVSFDDLSSEEKKRFQRVIASGELSKLIEPWDPWWLRPSARHISLSSNGARLVRPLENVLNADPLDDIPLGPESPLPSVTDLTAGVPSPLLAIHLLDVVYSYCFVLRTYNGDWKVDPLESATLLLSVSSILGQATQPETVPEALLPCLEQTCSPTYRHIGGLQFGLALVGDVVHILYLGGPSLICLLCDLCRLIQAAEREVKSEGLPKVRRVDLKRKLKAAERKIYFLMCWIHEQPSQVWSSLADITNAEKSSLAEEYAHESS